MCEFHKSESKRPFVIDGIKFCPECGYQLNYDDLYENYDFPQDVCYWCGQKLDLSGEDGEEIRGDIGRDVNGE